MNTNQETIKTAARRMCEHLGAKGVKVQHTAMLEALALGLGLDNWRTLKAVIDAPRAPMKPPKKSLPLGQWQQWSVSALYLDNQQQYGDSFAGRTPLEGAINGMHDRLTDFGLEIGIQEVRDADGECQLSPAFITDIQLLSNRLALATVLDSVAELPAATLSADHRLARVWLRVLLEYNEGDAFNELTEWSDSLKPNAADPVADGYVLTPTQALEALCDLGEEALGGVVKMEARDEKKAQAFYQVRAMCAYFADVLNDAGNGGIAKLVCFEASDIEQN